MIFSREDFKIDSVPDFLSFLLILPFVAFVFPFLGAAYTLGFLMDITGWLDS
ncbi:MAG: hypothetical protein H6618_01820 [Deltaproteobacteria bacterium]|nr:hypothetical protein [Deltaproteobacteria bacterium]